MDNADPETKDAVAHLNAVKSGAIGLLEVADTERRALEWDWYDLDFSSHFDCCSCWQFHRNSSELFSMHRRMHGLESEGPFWGESTEPWESSNGGADVSTNSWMSLMGEAESSNGGADVGTVRSPDFFF